MYKKGYRSHVDTDPLIINMVTIGAFKFGRIILQKIPK